MYPPPYYFNFRSQLGGILEQRKQLSLWPGLPDDGKTNVNAQTKTLMVKIFQAA